VKQMLFTLGILVSIVLLDSSAEAQNYPWCAEYRGPDGSMNCGFVSFEQCMATLSGIGGFCIRNNTYQPPPSESATAVGAAPGPNEAPNTAKPPRH
jgi:hypothetical protein